MMKRTATLATTILMLAMPSGTVGDESASAVCAAVADFTCTDAAPCVMTTTINNYQNIDKILPCEGNAASPDIIIDFTNTALEAKTAFASTAWPATNFDTTLTSFQKSGVCSLLDCNDDYNGLSAQLSSVVQPGETIRFVLSSYTTFWADTDVFKLTVDMSGAPPPGSCFHGQSLVTLEDKTTKAFTELQLGDKIMTAGADGVTFSFSTVHTLPHKAGNSEMAKFLQLTTESGKTVRMTPGHLIPKCDGVTVGASTLSVGDCLFTVSGKETLTAIASSLKFGVYTAVTKDKFIIVDGIVASSFSLESDADRMANLNDGLLNEGVKGVLGNIKTLLRGAVI